MMAWKRLVASSFWIQIIFSCWFASCLDNGLGRLPITGWTNGERFSCIVDCANYPNDCISERLIKSMADVLSLKSFREAGYQYIVIGDCWMDQARDTKGRLMADGDRFPNGMANLISYVHSKSLKVGLYVDLGNVTCHGYPGSARHYAQDAQTMFDWKVDMVTAGACGITDSKIVDQVYPEFGEQLNLTTRPILYACDWPVAKIKTGGQVNFANVMQTCNQYRVIGDTIETFDNLIKIQRYYSGYQYLFQNFSGPGSFNDPDQLVVGGYGLSSDQEQYQIAFWSILSAPFLVSSDLRQINPISKSFLLNKKVIAIHQDPLGDIAKGITTINQVQVWRKSILPVGSYAVGMFYPNIFGLPYPTSVQLSNIGVSGYARYNITEVFSGINYGIYKPWHTLDCEINPSGVLLFEIIAI